MNRINRNLRIAFALVAFGLTITLLFYNRGGTDNLDQIRKPVLSASLPENENPHIETTPITPAKRVITDKQEIEIPMRLKKAQIVSPPSRSKQDEVELLQRGFDLKLLKEEKVPDVRMQLNMLKLVIGQFYAKYNEYPYGGNAEITKALTGNNPSKIIFYEPDPKRLTVDGVLIDLWGTPYDMRKTDGGIVIRSAGPNRTFGDGDDETAP